MGDLIKISDWKKNKVISEKEQSYKNIANEYKHMEMTGRWLILDPDYFICNDCKEPAFKECFCKNYRRS